jgi:hypothetical protein
MGKHCVMLGAGFWAGAAQACPVPYDAPVWHAFGCEVGLPSGADFAAMSDASAVTAALVRQEAMVSLHYQSDAAPIVVAIDALLAKAALPVRSKAERLAIAAITEDSGEPVFDVAPVLERMVLERGMHMVYVETATDFATWAIWGGDVFCRWNRVRLSEFVSVSQITAIDAPDTYFERTLRPDAPRVYAGVAG